MKPERFFLLSYLDAQVEEKPQDIFIYRRGQTLYMIDRSQTKIKIKLHIPLHFHELTFSLLRD